MRTGVLLAAVVALAAACTSAPPARGTAASRQSERPTAGAPATATELPSNTGTDAVATPPAQRPAPPPEPVRPRLRVVGHTALGGGGFNGDVWAHDGFAYVGSWGDHSGAGPCPASGVKVADVREPSKPRRVAELENPEGTTAEDVTVVDVAAPRFDGALAAVGIQACDRDSSVFRGLQVFDVTNPRKPRELGRWAAPQGTVGCHEVDLVQVDDGRVLAGCALLAGARVGHGEAVFVDVTRPRRPRLAISWSDPDVDVDGGRGCLDFSVVHNIRFTPGGRRAWISYWDAGTVLLDLRGRTPRRMAVLERHSNDEDRDNHSVGFDGVGTLLINHEDFSPATPEANFSGCGPGLGGWGGITVFDVSGPGKARKVGSFTTKGSRVEEMETPHVNTVHNTEFVGPHDVFVSWYSQGVRWLDLSRRHRPREIDAWIPPRHRDPHRYFPRVPLVWGVSPMPGTDIILASDINSGLWVLQAVGLHSGR